MPLLASAADPSSPTCPFAVPIRPPTTAWASSSNVGTPQSTVATRRRGVSGEVSFASTSPLALPSTSNGDHRLLDFPESPLVVPAPSISTRVVYLLDDPKSEDGLLQQGPKCFECHDVVALCISYLPINSIQRCQFVSRTFYQACQPPVQRKAREIAAFVEEYNHDVEEAVDEKSVLPLHCKLSVTWFLLIFLPVSVLPWVYIGDNGKVRRLISDETFDHILMGSGISAVRGHASVPQHPPLCRHW